ncbi:nucleotide exchange factor GrpE [Metabacillus herbersteinensis]|uniref:Protein GrpE n=1 Tax=Metabacillus herbersteinensis TaxID=283816 RepID=A0ABV6G8Q2_9BACI
MTEEKKVAEQDQVIDTTSDEIIEPELELLDREDTNDSESQELAELKAKIVELESKLDENENKMLRVQADYDNFKRRSRLDMENAQKYRSQSLVTDILPALDNFERALQIEVDDEKMKSVLQGMNMVYKQLVQALQNEGVEEIESKDKPFDPHLHQAVMQVEDEAYESNTIIEELQKGYKLKDRIIRPAMVKVNQ